MGLIIINNEPYLIILEFFVSETSQFAGKVFLRDNVGSFRIVSNELVELQSYEFWRTTLPHRFRTLFLPHRPRPLLLTSNTELKRRWAEHLKLARRWNVAWTLSLRLGARHCARTASRRRVNIRLRMNPRIRVSRTRRRRPGMNGAVDHPLRVYSWEKTGLSIVVVVFIYIGSFKLMLKWFLNLTV